MTSPVWSIDDRHFMASALQLARQGVYSTHPNPRVGCVIVKDGNVIGRGFHERAGDGHAEVHALAEAGEAALDSTAYVTLEPCSHHGRTPPCAEALIKAGVSRVVAAMEDPNPLVAGSGMAKLRASGIIAESGLLESQARALNIGFVERMTTNSPYVRLKMGASLDGRTAMESGESQWITGPDAREDVQRWRAQSSAVLTGIGTVLEDNPKLTVRSEELLKIRKSQPLRVVLDPTAKAAGDELVFEPNGNVVYCVGAGGLVAKPVRDQQHIEVVELALDANSHFNLKEVLAVLADREINEVLVEAGAKLAGAFISQGCVHELLLYVAPKMMGSAARPLAELSIDRMADAYQLELSDMRVIGQDIRFQYRFVGS